MRPQRLQRVGQRGGGKQRAVVDLPVQAAFERGGEVAHQRLGHQLGRGAGGVLDEDPVLVRQGRAERLDRRGRQAPAARLEHGGQAVVEGGFLGHVEKRITNRHEENPSARKKT